MQERNEQGSKSTRDMLSAAAMMALLVTAAALYSAFATASHKAQLADSEKVGNAASLISRIPSVLAGVSTDGTKVNVPPGAAVAFSNVCGALGVAIVVLPGYFEPVPPPAGTATTQPGSPPTGPATTQPGTPTPVAGSRFEPPAGHISYCASQIAGSGTLDYRYVKPATSKVPLATLEVAKRGVTGATMAADAVEQDWWLAPMVFLVLALGLWRMRALSRRDALGLSTAQVIGLLQEQEALLRGISEGVVGCDRDGRIRFVNAEARRLLNLPANSVGRPIRHLVRGRRLRQILTGEIPGRDLPVVVGQSILSVSRMSVERDEMHLGFVITVSDRTEWEGLLRELDGMVGMTEALRAQAHEFSNKIHTIVGLIELGEVDEAASFAMNLSARREDAAERVESIADQMLKALILAKGAVASEKGVDLILEDSSHQCGRLHNQLDVVTLLGNLIDNALDAVMDGRAKARGPQAEGWISVWISTTGADLHLRVTDSGPGVPAEVLPSIFVDGFSTKSSKGGYRRGLGLALVAQITSGYDGMVTVENVPGASFAVELQNAVEPDGEEAAEPIELLAEAAEAGG